MFIFRMKNVADFQMSGTNYTAAWQSSNGFRFGSDNPGLENGTLTLDNKPWHTSFGNPYYSPVSMDPQALDTASRTSSKKRVSFDDETTEIIGEPIREINDDTKPEETVVMEPNMTPEDDVHVNDDVPAQNNLTDDVPTQLNVTDDVPVQNNVTDDVPIHSNYLIPPAPPPPPSSPPPHPDTLEGSTSFIEDSSNSIRAVPLINADTQVDSLSISNSMNSVQDGDLSCTPQGKIVLQNNDLQQLGYY